MKNTAQSWLEVQCSTIPGIARGVVLARAADTGEMTLAAQWPVEPANVLSELIDAAREAASSQAAVVRVLPASESEAGPMSVIAYPLRTPTVNHGAAALSVPGEGQPQHQAILQLLQWGAAWFDLLHQPGAGQPGGDRATDVLELLVGSLEHDTFAASATALVTELAGRFDCERVSLGLQQRQHVVLEALSHSAHIDTRINLARDIGDAMDECIDQDATVGFPPIAGAPPVVSFAQEVLSDHSNRSAICSTPLFAAGNAIGALTFERAAGRDFDQSTVESFEAVAALLGPVIALKHDHDRPVALKVWVAFCGSARRLLGAGHFALKLNAMLAVATIMFFSVAKGEYRVTAPAALEGRVQRAITAPQDGYIASAHARAGDTVEAGEVLATLDDRDLQLERGALDSKREQLRQEHRVALSAHDRAASALTQAQIRQIEAQLNLVDGKLTRVRLLAPFSGIVVSGDLSQALGSPVEHGQVLFQVAPLDSYRVMLNVDERDIGEIEAKQRGRVALTGLPNETIALSTVRVLPVSVAEDGSNFFRVEAALEETGSLLRPGMEGVAKIDVEPRKLIWIWSHTLIDWLRLSLWTWIS